MATQKIRGYVRDPSTGAGINAVTVSLKRHNGGGTITTDATDANGLFEIDHDTATYGGPVFLTFTSGSTTDIHSGNVVGQIAGLIWAADIPDVFALLGVGVANGLAASAAGTDMEVDVSAGFALLKDGFPYLQEATQAVAIGASDATHPRIDRVVLRLVREGQTDQGKITLEVVAGSPAASPTAPALTQSAATWEFSLARVLVNAAVTSIAADKVTDERASTTLSQARAFAYPTGLSTGDLFTIDADGALARLAKGTSGQFLKQGASLPAWDTITDADVPGLWVERTGDTMTGDLLLTFDSLTALLVEDAGGDNLLVVNTTDHTVGLQHGGDFIMFSDNGVTQVFRVDGTTGVVNAEAIFAASIAVAADADLGNSAGDTTTVWGHLTHKGPPPASASTGAALGTGGSGVTVAGTDQSGRLTITAGTTGLAAGTATLVSFATAKPDSNFSVILSASDADTGLNAVGFYRMGQSTGGFSVGFQAAPTSGAVYVIDYHIWPWKNP